MSDNTVPEKIDGYKVIKQLGKGSFAKVYLVSEKHKGEKLYALKEILQPQWKSYIDEEIAALKIMSTFPNAPKLHRVKTKPQQTYLLMDYVQSSDIRQHVDTHGVFSEPYAFRFLLDVLAQLSYIHAHNTLHLDIKMSNIMRFNNRYCLIDWGISRSQVCVKTSNILGGSRYLAPETYQGFRGQASEIYSLGCVLYYCISGKYLFNLKKKDPLDKKIYATMNLSPQFEFPVTKKLKYITWRMLDKDPLKRATIEEIENIVAGHLNIGNYRDLNINRTIPEGTYAKFKEMAEDGRGIIYAQYRLALMYEKGDSTEYSIQKALFWYKNAAIAGYALAQHRLGFLFYSGKHGVIKNLKTAFYWFSKAANQKYKRSLYFLGKMYEQGNGVQHDINKAIGFYQAAVHHCDLKAEKRLRKLLHEKKG